MEILQNPWVLLAIAAWVIPWKGVALWKAARFGQKKWFIVMLVLNTLAILEIFYIFVIARKKSVEIEKSN
ncbi:MAG: DUF5652 family protein [Patescibacteria group bacterium]